LALEVSVPGRSAADQHGTAGIDRFKSTLGLEECCPQVEDQGNPGDHHSQRAAISFSIQYG